MKHASGDQVRVAVAGVGAYLPERVLTNGDLETMVDTTDEWIRTRTGMRERRIAGPDESTSDMATKAAERALKAAGVTPDEVDLIIVATVTPDMVFPSTACFVQTRLGVRQALCFDLEAACSGFLYGVEIGRRMIEAGGIRTALVIGAEKLSAVTDWKDRATCVLFGDGAGAAVLRRARQGRGIMGTVAGADGSLAGLLSIPAGGSRQPASEQTVRDRLHYIKMTGNEVFKHAVRCMCDAATKVLERSAVTFDQVDCVIPHQANMRIIQAIADRLGDSEMRKFFVNLERVGNISAASVPVALEDAIRCGRIRPGSLVLMVAFGGGFTWGASLIEWEG